MADNGVSKGLLVGFLTGGIVGAAVALLYAPKSGKELRSDIRNTADEVMVDAEKYLETAKIKANEVVNEGKKRSEELISDARKKAEALLKDTEKVLGDARTKANDAISSGKTTFESESDRIKDAVKTGLDTYKESKS